MTYRRLSGPEREELRGLAETTLQGASLAYASGEFMAAVILARAAAVAIEGLLDKEGDDR